LLLAGCAAESELPIEWRGDERCTAEQREEIERGQAWLYEHAGLEPSRIAWTYRAGEAIEPRTIRCERGPVSATGLCFGGAVYFDFDGNDATGEPPIAKESWAGLAAHEMAHCRLGFEDGYSEGRRSDGVMRVLSPLRWSAFESAECARGGCSGVRP
jgi:hypothetical protein